MNLDEMKSVGQLVEHSASLDQVEDIWEAAQRCLSDAGIESVSSQLRLTLAYEVIFHCATLALYASGYRVAHKQESHYLTMQTLQFTLAREKSKVEYYQRLRRKRHQDKYDGRLHVSETELVEATNEAEDIIKETQTLLSEIYPELFK